MHLRRVTLVLTVSLVGTALSALSAKAACAVAPPRISLTGFEVPEGPRLFYLGVENAGTKVKVLIAGGCNGAAISADFATSPGTAFLDTDYEHVSSPPRISATPPNDGSEEEEQPVFIHGGEEEAIVESLQFTLSNPQSTGGAGVPTLIIPSAPILIVDSDGADRVAFEGVPYSQSETFPTARIPVFRAGEITGPTTVDYTVEPGPNNPATPGADYTVTSPPTLQFNAGDRWETIDLSVVNDDLGEGPEDVTIALTGDEVAEPSTTTFTIIDNEENVPPRSRFHHPRNKWKYNKADYRIREFHIFATDEGGSGVVAAEMALRRNLKNGKCAWKMKKGWQKKDCQNRTWLPTKYDDVGELFYYRMKQLKSSVGTKIKNYTAFSRAIDGAGNVEKEFAKKRNANTFEIRRKGKTQKAKT
jgi:hypothetical protein